jgi:hypothetical protein
MRRTKDLLLRTFDDTGADTLEKHWAQIEYTAYWCIQALMPATGVTAVIPEGIEDVTLVRDTYYELHQAKCRDESQQPWTTAEVLPILCKQYNRRNAFAKPCQYHFVTDHVADAKTQFRPGVSFGQLYRLKYLLDIEHDGQQFAPLEKTELAELESDIIPKIIQLMASQHGEAIGSRMAYDLLHSSWIDTKSPYLRGQPPYDNLATALETAYPGQPACTMPQLAVIFERILLLIRDRIIREVTISGRTITRDDVMSCRDLAMAPEPGLPCLDRLPGQTRLEKKTLHGGFDTTELPVFARQRLRVLQKRRELEALGLADRIEDLYLALLTYQQQSRREASRLPLSVAVGPKILDLLGPSVSQCVQTYFPDVPNVDVPFCYGLIWDATNKCELWWHRLDRDDQNGR